MTPVQQTKSGRSAFWIGMLVVIVLLGIAYQMRTAAQKRNTFTNDDTFSLGANIGAVPTAVQASAEQSVQTFLSDLQHGNYDHALSATASDFPTPHTATALKLLAQKKSFSIIFTRPLKFEPAHFGSHGKEIILLASLQGDARPYRTVCTLDKKNGVWLVSGVLDPVPPSSPPMAASPGSVKSK